MAAVPRYPELVAVMVADPAPTPVAMPEPLTVTTLVLLEDQVTIAPDMTCPYWFFTTAVSWPLWPTVPDRDDGETVTVRMLRALSCPVPGEVTEESVDEHAAMPRTVRRPTILNRERR